MTETQHAREDDPAGTRSRADDPARIATDAAGIGIWDYDVAAGTLMWDDAMYRLYGRIPSGEIEQYALWERSVLPEDLDRARADLAAAINGERPFDTEFRIVRPDGAVRSIKASARVLRRDDGTPLRVIGVNQDVTDQRTAERALLDSEHRFRSVFESSNDAIFLLTEAGFFDCNPRALAMFRLDGKEALEGIHPADLSPPEQPDGRSSLEAAAAHIRSALEQGEARFEWMHRRADGDVFPAEVLLSAFTYRGRTILQATVRDITRRRAAEHALRVSEARLALTLRASHTGLWDWNLVTNEVYFSPEWKRQLGYEDDELPNEFSVWEERLHPQDHDRSVAVTMAYIADPGPDFENEFRLRHKDGSYRWILTRAAVERDAQGRSVRMFGLHLDITDRKRAEEELRIKTELLEQANRELESFSYSVSHDLRAPLRHISGFVELLQNGTAGTLDGKNARWLATIGDAARDMGKLIDDLLVFSRMGRADMLDAPVDMRRLVEEVIDTLRPETEGRAVEWSVGEMPVVRGDPSMLKLVLVNLLGNAVKYSRGRNPARISFTCTPREAEWEFHTSDNGAGFDMAYADKLFGVFQRLHSAREYEGTGIGLANVQRIVHRHGGRVRAEGRVDAGATFTFTLPRKEAAP